MDDPQVNQAIRDAIAMVRVKSPALADAMELRLMARNADPDADGIVAHPIAMAKRKATERKRDDAAIVNRAILRDALQRVTRSCADGSRHLVRLTIAGDGSVSIEADHGSRSRGLLRRNARILSAWRDHPAILALRPYDAIQRGRSLHRPMDCRFDID